MRTAQNGGCENSSLVWPSGIGVGKGREEMEWGRISRTG